MSAIRAYRQQHHLSQRKLAERLSEALERHVPFQKISEWEKDPERVPADVKAALALPDELGSADDEELLRQEGEGGEGDGVLRDQDAAPSRPQPAGPGGSTPRLPVTRGELANRITQFYGYVALGLSQLDPHDGQALLSIAAPAGAAWAKVCEQNPRVARIWQLLTAPGGIWGELALVHAPVVVAILAHHNLLPELRLFPRPEESPAEDKPVAAAA